MRRTCFLVTRLYRWRQPDARGEEQRRSNEEKTRDEESRDHRVSRRRRDGDQAVMASAATYQSEVAVPGTTFFAMEQDGGTQTIGFSKRPVSCLNLRAKGRFVSGATAIRAEDVTYRTNCTLLGQTADVNFRAVTTPSVTRPVIFAGHDHTHHDWDEIDDTARNEPILIPRQPQAARFTNNHRSRTVPRRQLSGHKAAGRRTEHQSDWYHLHHSGGKGIRSKATYKRQGEL
jgi:hypothetical protein